MKQTKEDKLRAYIRDLRGDPLDGGTSQQDVGAYLRITQEAYSMLESGARPIRLVHLVQLAKFHKVPLAKFLRFYDVQDNEHVLASELGLTTAGVAR